MLASFEPTWCTSYSEFGNYEIPLKTQESKIFEISFDLKKKNTVWLKIW
jgi:hypothetical protein